MQLNSAEISELIKKQVESFEAVTEARNEGTVVSLSDGIVRVHGLQDVMMGEMIEFPGNTYGMALNLERDSVGAVVLGSYEHITEGDKVKCTGRILEVPVGEALQGRVVNALGLPIDVEIVAGTTDSTAAFIASGAKQIGQAVTSLGSTLVLKIISDKEINDPAHGVYSQPFGQHWLVGGASNSGGAVLNYYFSEEQMTALTKELKPETNTNLNY